MAYFNEFPHTRTYDSDLGWLIQNMRQVIETVENYNELHFADPVVWNITTQYETATVVRDGIDGPLYISKKPVPAGINITNGEYWEILGGFDQMFTGVIKNVQDYGAIGIPGADYTEQVQAAIDDGNIIYFPAGEYSFKNVTITKPVYLFGDGETTIFKPQHRTETSNQYATMIVSTNDITLDNIKFVGDNSIETQTGTQYYQAAIVQATGSRFRMTRCIIDKIFDTYHLSQGDLEFFDRNGLLLYVHDTDTAEIDHCIFHEYGGEELIWISRALARFGDPAQILIHDNEFTDRVPLDSGGVIDGGSAINVLGGNILFYNNICDRYYERGSFVNLLGNNTEAYSNSSYNSDMASWIDTCEGYYSKSHSVSFHDNFFEDKNNKTSYAVKFMAVKASIKDNHLEGSCPIKSYGITAASQNTDGRSYIGDNADWPVYDCIDISGNTVVLTHNGTNYLNCGISLSQTNQPFGSRSVINNVVIKDNVVMAKTAVTTFYNTIYIQARFLQAVIKGNRLPFGGTSSPSSSALVFIGIGENIATGDSLTLDGNVFDGNGSPTNIQILSITGASLPTLTAQCVHNTIISSAVKRVFAALNATGLTGDYNFGATGLT